MTPKLAGTPGEEAARTARDKQAAKAQKEAGKEAEKAAKRAALADKRAERAARRAEREAEKRNRTGEGRDESDGTADAPDDEIRDEGVDAPGERPVAITVVHYAPGEEPDGPRR